MTNPNSIKKINNRSEIWKCLNRRRNNKNYYIFRQLNAEEKGTGHIRIIESKKCDINISLINWRYDSVGALDKDYLYFSFIKTIPDKFHDK